MAVMDTASWAESISGEELVKQRHRGRSQMCAGIGKQAGWAEVKEKESSKQIRGTKENLNGDFDILG